MTQDKLKVLDIFSGIGGFSLGLERTGGFETVAFCEIEEFPRKVLNKHWPDVPIYDDVRTLKHDGAIDVICGGYPCQPFSVAGNRKGKEDDRHLWPAMFSLIQKHRPTWVIGENVAGHINMGLDDVLADLEGENYECRAFVIPACAIDAKHRRDRVWIVANSRYSAGRDKWSTQERDHSQRKRTTDTSEIVRSGSEYSNVGYAEYYGLSATEVGSCIEEASLDNKKRKVKASQFERAGEPRNGSDVAYTKCIGQSRQGWTEGQVCSETKRYRQASWAISNGQWPPEPDVGRMAHGVPNGVDRLKSLGNAVVPQIPEIIGNAILEAMEL